MFVYMRALEWVMCKECVSFHSSFLSGPVPMLQLTLKPWVTFVSYICARVNCDEIVFLFTYIFCVCVNQHPICNLFCFTWPFVQILVSLKACVRNCTSWAFFLFSFLGICHFYILLVSRTCLSHPSPAFFHHSSLFLYYSIFASTIPSPAKATSPG